jgi:hypothetical protein
MSQFTKKRIKAFLTNKNWFRTCNTVNADTISDPNPGLDVTQKVQSYVLLFSNFNLFYPIKIYKIYFKTFLKSRSVFKFANFIMAIGYISGSILQFGSRGAKSMSIHEDPGE